MIRTLLIITALLAASCSPIVDNRGHNAREDDYKQVIEGQSRTEDVQAVLGSPSATSTFGGLTWYYITEKKETRGMLAPEVVDQQVVAIHFDENQTVSDIERYKKEAGKPVQIVDKTTPTEGRKMTFMEQMLGNFGRFNAPGREIDPRNMGR